jgi:hypothetical protein
MFDVLAKNVWLLLTVVLPGFFTYGLLRLVLFFAHSNHLTPDVLTGIDSSALITTSIIIAIALLQQFFSIAIEGLCALCGRLFKIHVLTTLFFDRFMLSAKGTLTETQQSIVGNFFLSFNISVGIIMVIVYCSVYESVHTGVLYLLLAGALVAAVYRGVIAVSVIRNAGKNQ